MREGEQLQEVQSVDGELRKRGVRSGSLHRDCAGSPNQGKGYKSKGERLANEMH